jgi:hypothetical protein
LDARWRSSSCSAARYEAIAGSSVSQALKLTRRSSLTGVTESAGRIHVSGRVSGSFKAGTAERIRLRVTCRSSRTVDTLTLTKSGTCSASVAPAVGVKGPVAVYRACTTVLRNGHREPTDSLPVPVS